MNNEDRRQVAKYLELYGDSVISQAVNYVANVVYNSECPPKGREQLMDLIAERIVMNRSFDAKGYMLNREDEEEG